MQTVAYFWDNFYTSSLYSLGQKGGLFFGSLADQVAWDA